MRSFLFGVPSGHGSLSLRLLWEVCRCVSWVFFYWMKVCEVTVSAACWTVIPGSLYQWSVIRSALCLRGADANWFTLFSYFLYFCVLYRHCSTLLLSFCRVFRLRVELGPVSEDIPDWRYTTDLHTICLTSWKQINLIVIMIIYITK